MISMRWLAAPLLVVGVTACGSSGGSSEAKWCDVATKLEAKSDVFDEIDPSDPDSMKKTFAALQDDLAEAADAAPKEIKDAVEQTKSAFDDMIAALEKADFNLGEIDQDAFAQLGDAMTQASDEITSFNEKECGIKPASTDANSTDDTSTEEVPTDDTVGSDSGSGGLEGTAREQITTMLEGIGLTAEEAGCVADNIDPDLAGAASADPSLMLDVFTKCDIDMARLTELGQN